ncbi:LysR family transcriptional regulator [Niveispirillum sp. KHB5.9]|uniref:LysR family transcriptional regulator n=1 Tax=Niveispirillum sp. KHB5.9 TaxID=3400269 RepID=UPI003A841015
MSRLDINRAGEMEVFARVVESGNFSGAARALDMTPSAVSKLVARMEARLGARLLNRTTRQLRLTPEGDLFHERCRRILADMDEAEQAVAARAVPRGPVRINTFVPFGVHYLLPLLPRLSALYPEIQLDITLTDTVVDLLQERADIAIRVGPLKGANLMARKLAQSRVVVVASPDYLARHGTPRTPYDLAQHNMMAFGFVRSVGPWPFRLPDGTLVEVPVRGNTILSDGESMRQLALAGHGLGRHAWFHVGPDILAGRLVALLEDYNSGETEIVHVVFQGGPVMPPRIRAVIDFLAREIKLA